MERGWVYVMVNSSIPGMAKVGRTTRLPDERAAELSSATGVVMPFVVAYDHIFADCVQAEQDVHAVLDARGIRAAANREFFVGPTADIVRVVLQVAAQAGPAPDLTAEPAADDWLAQGDRFLFGRGNTFQDIGEALRCFRRAAGCGSLLAHERLGAIYTQAPGKRRGSRRNAMKWLQRGAERGNYYCYVEMAMLYMLESHTHNFTKAWDRFFTDRNDHPCAEVERGDARYVTALRRYVSSCIDMGLRPAHLAELKANADGLVACFSSAAKALRHAPDARMRMAGALRWTYENLYERPPAQAMAPVWRARAAATRWHGRAQA